MLVCFKALGEPVGLSEVLMISLLADLMFLVSITPSAIGLREAVIALGGTLLGVDPAVAVAAAILDRIVTTIMVVLLAQLGIWRLVRPAER